MLRTFLKPLSLLPAIVLMYLIFSFSAQPGEVSSQVSYKVSYKIVETGGKLLGADFEPWEIDELATRFNGPIRKIAHMTEYFALAIAVSFPLYVYGLRGLLLMLLAGLFCVGFSCADEYHQSFVAGRSPAARDVMIDSIGIFVGIIVVRIIGWTGRMTLFRAPKKEPLSQQGFQEYAPSQPKLTRKQKKQMKQQAAMGRPPAGYVPGQSSGYPPYPGSGYSNPYPGGPYPNGFQNQPYPPEPDANNHSVEENAYASQDYTGAAYSGSAYSNGSGQGNPYQGSPYQGSPYPGTPYQGGPYPGAPYQGGSYPGAPQYYGQAYDPQYAEQPDHSSDELSEDMPLSHLLNPKNSSKKK